MTCPCGRPLDMGVDHGDTETGDPICQARQATVDRLVPCEQPGCTEVLPVGLDAHETWDGTDLHFWCHKHCPDCEDSK